MGINSEVKCSTSKYDILHVKYINITNFITCALFIVSIVMPVFCFVSNAILPLRYYKHVILTDGSMILMSHIAHNCQLVS